jgi:hypothetical protein
MTASPSRRQAEPATDYIPVERNFTEVCVCRTYCPTSDAFVEPRSFPVLVRRRAVTVLSQ